jgi:signal transduction histidine kinase
MPFDRVLEARATVVVEDLVIHRHDGRKVCLRVVAKPLFDAHGTITHVLETFTDKTREVEAEKRRAEGERRIARSQRLESIGHLVAGIAHDFNNLLTVTKLSASWLHAEEQNDERRTALGQVSAVTESAIELVRNLLRFARPEPPIRRLMSIEAAVEPVLEVASRTFLPGVALRTELDTRGALILGDASQLEQLIMNLVLNARDAIPGPGTVTVRSRRRVVTEGEPTVLPEGHYVVLEVVDTGSGIDPAIRERIFDPYFTTKTQGAIKGTGLGLSTVHGIALGHGASLEVLDNEPDGTIVRVTFPQASHGNGRSSDLEPS